MGAKAVVKKVIVKAKKVFKKVGQQVKGHAKLMKIKVHVRPKDCKCTPKKKAIHKVGKPLFHKKKAAGKKPKKVVKKPKKVVKKAKKVTKKVAKKVALKKAAKKAAPKKAAKKVAPKKK